MASKASTTSGQEKASKSKASRSKATKPENGAGAAQVEALQGNEAAYLRFLPQAEALSAAEVQSYRGGQGGVEIAYHNALLAVEALAPLRERIEQELPTVHVARLIELPELVAALAFASGRVDRNAPSAHLVRELVLKLAPVRDVMLRSAELFAKVGLLPSREVSRIREGRGYLDMAKDVMDLSALFRKYAAKVRGKLPLSTEQENAAVKWAAELQQRVRPLGARKRKVDSPELAHNIEVRDRFYTLLVARFARPDDAGMIPLCTFS